MNAPEHIIDRSRYTWHGWTPLQRFMRHVQKTDSCWLWTGAINRNGYGSFWLNGRVETASRAAYQLLVGEISHGLFVLHRCDNPKCVRPDHLFLGDHATNMRDRNTKGRAYRGIGEGNPRARLTATDAVAIRSSRAASRTLAGMFGVSMSTVQRIRSGKQWTHL